MNGYGREDQHVGGKKYVEQYPDLRRKFYGNFKMIEKGREREKLGRKQKRRRRRVEGKRQDEQQIWSIRNILEIATWRKNTSYYSYQFYRFFLSFCRFLIFLQIPFSSYFIDFLLIIFIDSFVILQIWYLFYRLLSTMFFLWNLYFNY